MELLEKQRIKDEKVNGIIYDMSPTPNFRHGIINGNIYRIIGNGLKNSTCLVFMENLDFHYHPNVNDSALVDKEGICYSMAGILPDTCYYAGWFALVT